MPQTIAHQAPIAVYQMGKVGSETIVNSLNNLNLSVPIYHIHILSKHNLNSVIPRYQQQDIPLTLQLQHSQKLRDYLDNNPMPSLNVVTAIRELISQYISAFFQNVKTSHPHFINEDGCWKEDSIYEYLYQEICNYNPESAWNCNWFDNHFKIALNIDVYQREFDKNLGYAEFNKENIKVLILQLEKSSNWSYYISDFLQLQKPLEIIKSNFGDSKDYKKVYDSILNRIKIPVSRLEAIYQSKFCQHFYSDKDLKNFFDKWSTEKK